MISRVLITAPNRRSQFANPVLSGFVCAASSVRWHYFGPVRHSVPFNRAARASPRAYCNHRAVNVYLCVKTWIWGISVLFFLKLSGMHVKSFLNLSWPCGVSSATRFPGTASFLFLKSKKDRENCVVVRWRGILGGRIWHQRKRINWTSARLGLPGSSQSFWGLSAANLVLMWVSCHLAQPANSPTSRSFSVSTESCTSLTCCFHQE